MKKKNQRKILSREEMLLKGKPLPDAEIYIEAFGGCVEMQNVSFPRLCAIKRECESPEQYNVNMVAAVCKELSAEDVEALQENPAVFAQLFEAVQRYIGGGFTDEEIKK